MNRPRGRWVGTEVREPPSFHEINNLEEFLTIYEDEVLDSQRLLALNIALKDTPARWWGAHKETIKNWYQCKRLLRIRFGAEKRSNQQKNYDGQGAPTKHLEKCRELWKMTSLEEFLTNYEEDVLENKRLLDLDISLKDTPARWWGAHKETI